MTIDQNFLSTLDQAVTLFQHDRDRQRVLARCASHAVARSGYEAKANTLDWVLKVLARTTEYRERIREVRA